MNKVFYFALLAGGIALIVYGISASNSVGSGVSRLFSGAPTNKSLALLIGGILAAAIGAGGLIRGSKSL